VQIQEPEPEPAPAPKVEPPPPPVVVAVAPQPPRRRARHVIIHHGIRRTDLVRAGYVPVDNVDAPAPRATPPVVALPPALDPPSSVETGDVPANEESEEDNSAALARDFGA
jgi:hypothetical protein